MCTIIIALVLTGTVAKRLAYTDQDGYRASIKNWVRVGVMVSLTVRVSSGLELMLG